MSNTDWKMMRFAAFMIVAAGFVTWLIWLGSMKAAESWHDGQHAQQAE